MLRHGPSIALAVIVILSCSLGVAYALRTPPWQNPDEPAHYNYIRYIAETGTLPVLQVGDYQQAYLSRIVAAKFPSDLSIDPLRYEFHQPPLYYVAMTPAYLATKTIPASAQLRSLRLASLVLAPLLLALVYLLVLTVFPDRPWTAVATAAFVALLPQHLAVEAAVNNDLLAETLLTAILLLLVRRLMAPPTAASPAFSRANLALGVLLGLAILTKTTVYLAFGVFGLALLLDGWRRRREPGMWRWAGRQAALVLAIALLVGGWWWARNLAEYGDTDFAGLVRHDLVVADQPRTGALTLSAAAHLVTGTFRSFWLQLGWMSVPATNDVYGLLAGLSAAAGVGAILYVTRLAREPGRLDPGQRLSLVLLAAVLVLVVAALVGYNLTFIQTQGRYLFPATGVIGLFFVLGLGELVRRRYHAPIFAGVFGWLLWLNLSALVNLVPLLSPR